MKINYCLLIYFSACLQLAIVLQKFWCKHGGSAQEKFSPPLIVARWIIILTTFALALVVRDDLLWDIYFPIPPGYCMVGLLACSVTYEFGQFDTGLSWFRYYTAPKAEELVFLKNKRHP